MRNFVMDLIEVGKSREFSPIAFVQASALGQNLHFCNFFSLSSLWKELLSRKKGLETTLPFAKYNILLRWMWDELCCGGVLREFWRNRDYLLTVWLTNIGTGLKTTKVNTTIDVQNTIIWHSTFCQFLNMVSTYVLVIRCSL